MVWMSDGKGLRVLDEEKTPCPARTRRAEITMFRQQNHDHGCDDFHLPSLLRSLQLLYLVAARSRGSSLSMFTFVSYALLNHTNTELINTAKTRTGHSQRKKSRTAHGFQTNMFQAGEKRPCAIICKQHRRAFVRHRSKPVITHLIIYRAASPRSSAT